MARDRQKAKQRQAERRAARLAREAEAGRGAVPGVTGDEHQDALLAAGAPPQDEGMTEQVVSHEPPSRPNFNDEELVEAELQAEAAGAPVDAALTDPPADRHKHGRVIGFLLASWAELQRVEWPDRQALTTMTGVVLGFVVIAGGYLGLLDAIFSRLVQAIL